MPGVTGVYLGVWGLLAVRHWDVPNRLLSVSDVVNLHKGQDRETMLVFIMNVYKHSLVTMRFYEQCIFLICVEAVVTTLDCSGVCEFTIWHVGYELILAAGGRDRCSHCTQYREKLPILARRVYSMDDKISGWTDPSSHTNYRFLTSPEKTEWLRELHHQHHLV